MLGLLLLSWLAACQAGTQRKRDVEHLHQLLKASSSFHVRYLNRSMGMSVEAEGWVAPGEEPRLDRSVYWDHAPPPSPTITGNTISCEDDALNHRTVKRCQFVYSQGYYWG